MFFSQILFPKSHGRFPHVSSCLALRLSPAQPPCCLPKFPQNPGENRGPGEQAARGCGRATPARCRERCGLQGVSSLACMSQINNIFHFCLSNYTGSFFQGSSRPPHSLIASASTSRLAQPSCLQSSLRFPWRRCPHGGGWRGECQVEQPIWPQHPSSWGPGGVSNQVKKNKEMTEMRKRDI